MTTQPMQYQEIFTAVKIKLFLTFETFNIFLNLAQKTIVYTH